MSAVGRNSKMFLEDIWRIQPSLNKHALIPYLCSLDLDQSLLQKVEANAFKIILELVSVDFSDCKIERVAAWAIN